MGSIGERIYNSKLLLDTAELFAWTIVIVVMSWLCERAFVAVLARTGSWSQRLSLCVGRPRDAYAQTGAQDQASRRNPAASPSPTILLKDASVGYKGTVVATGFNLAVLPGDHVLLADRSGAGKTTLLRTVAGLQDVLAGTCTCPARPTMAFQESRLVEEMSAVQNVLLVMGSARDEAACSRVRSLLSELLPEAALDVPVRRALWWPAPQGRDRARARGPGRRRPSGRAVLLARRCLAREGCGVRDAPPRRARARGRLAPAGRRTTFGCHVLLAQKRQIRERFHIVLTYREVRSFLI
jgi:ABC-type sugar transport system ATPase subunit